MKISDVLLLAALSLDVFVACATQPVAYNSEKMQGQWDAKVQIQDFEHQKSNNLNLQVIAEKNRAVRMEVTGTMGVNIASLLLKGDDISYAIHTQKRFISGSASEKALMPLFSIDVDPRWLYAIFFDETIPEKNWVCRKGLDLKIERCERAQDGLKIFWSERHGENKRVTLSNAKFELQILVKSFTTKVQSPERAFTLTPPEGYKRYKLQ